VGSRPKPWEFRFAQQLQGFFRAKPLASHRFVEYGVDSPHKKSDIVRAVLAKCMV
jgi:hypothetical protein